MSELDENWRPVAIVTSPNAMRRPAPEVLKKLIYDWEKAAEEGAGPAVLVRWGDEELVAREEAPTPVPRALGMEEPKPVPDIAAGTGTDPGGSPAGGTSTGFPTLPPPGSRMRAPNKVPDKIAEETKPERESAPIPEPEPDKAVPTDPESTTPEKSQKAPQVFKDRENAIRSQGTGFFNTAGFPLGDYASEVIALVKGNWMIPSNLRDSKGRTTIIFFIGKDGQYLDAQIVIPSGSPSLDIAALSAIIGSNPFPPLPEGFPSDRVGAKFVFSYNERQ